ncbi:hypothetical protein MTR_8g087700 [Medicago truncatula]|uniref:Uncharacterized protein n=2 Tax=Medicago truncatula TaxID=3880 RepID=G7L7B4_MEDTR|nr:hypothetical protein MTR_8g087700 [Medicago truncatula]
MARFVHAIQESSIQLKTNEEIKRREFQQMHLLPLHVQFAAAELYGSSISTTTTTTTIFMKKTQKIIFNHNPNKIHTNKS